MATYFVRPTRLEGVGTLIDETAFYLKRDGHDVDVVCRESVRGYKRFLKNHVDDYDRVFVFENNPVTALFLSNKVAGESGHVVTVVMSPFQHLRSLFTVPFSKQYFAHCLAKNWLWSKLVKFRGHRYIVSTQYQLEQLVIAGIDRRKVHVSPYGTAITPANKKAARDVYGFGDKFVVGYLGHFSPIKGVPLLIEAFSRMPGKNTALALAWSGKGEEKNKVSRLIDQKRREGNEIMSFGEVDRSLFLAAVDVVVLPYTCSSIPHIPLVLLESFAVGTPVIASNVGGLSEIVIDGDTGVLVKPNNEDAILYELSRLHGNPSLRERISRGQKKAVAELYNTDTTVKNWMRIYDELD